MNHWVSTLLPLLFGAGLTEAECADETILSAELVQFHLLGGH